MTTRDARGREVFGIDPAILAGAATFRQVSPTPAQERDPGVDPEHKAAQDPASTAERKRSRRREVPRR